MRGKRSKNGFSLMEVMVALALLALSFTSLVLVQSRATNLAVQSRYISTATQLARFQLMECKREVEKIISSASDFKQEGDYQEQGFDEYKWECHAPRFNMRPPSASQVESRAKANAPKGLKDEMSTTSSAMSPMISLITESLGNSVRELVVVIRWKNNGIDDEVRVVTHVVDLNAMGALANMLKQTTGNFSSGPNNSNTVNTQQQPAGQPSFPPRFRGGAPNAP
ncbi:MAG: prepilin-type N-terminal cleavage/methylation domain-containing protein [Myxococcales bacterium]|nr:prepilin-type N-terminal cleavage/methylation domain-containing protein [Myxococcales bacterium]USN49886.1 MAG: prepilin-type N-terminal cleavage/methylation domain-containing protein [Myxococcales bacterium]